MDAIQYLPLSLLGLFIGLLVWSRAVRWIISLFVAFQSKRNSTVAAGSWWNVAMVGLLSSAPWLLIIVLASATYILSRPHGEGWVWFFCGMLATPLLIAINLLQVLRRLRKRKVA
jgi:hypothetical protein